MIKKAARIRKLLHLQNAAIAARTGYPESYIRTVRQRTGTNGQPIYTAADLRRGREWHHRWYWERGGREVKAKYKAEARAP